MCPKPNATTISALSKKSHVEDLPESSMPLFNALVVEPDEKQRWEALTFPIDFKIDVLESNLQKEIKLLQSKFH